MLKMQSCSISWTAEMAGVLCVLSLLYSLLDYKELFYAASFNISSEPHTVDSIVHVFSLSQISTST